MAFPHYLSCIHMTQQNTLEEKGSLSAYPLSELIVEIKQLQMSGSLRLSHQNRKAIIYFNDGEVIYAVSNSKEHRLFNMMLKKKAVSQEQLSGIPQFANDVELAQALSAKGILTKEAIDRVIVEQIDAILIDLLTWIDGEWAFSPLARLRADMSYPVNMNKVLISYARCLPLHQVADRFKSVEESFSVSDVDTIELGLLSHEQFVAERFGRDLLTISQIRAMAPLPEQGLLQALYVLWLGGVLIRQNWNAAFSDAKSEQIKAAKLSVVKKAASAGVSQTSINSSDNESQTDASESVEVVEEKPKTPAVEITLEEYLERIEKAENHYDTLGIASKADASEIKTAYFGLAKMFHPDRFHREAATTLRRIQTAFTSLAQAYETLKTKESRENYDYKIRKELEAREKRRAEGLADEPDSGERQTEQGLDSFEKGLLLLSEEEYEAAATNLARAVHYSPENALYHAYYGKALSVFTKHRHKAEAEFQTAIKLDQKNVKIRLMLVEFFVDMNMAKRAEGELKRFLEVVPNNPEATSVLKRLQSGM